MATRQFAGVPFFISPSKKMASPKSPTLENLRILPHSIEAEQAVLGGLLLSGRAWEQVVDIVGEADFYREAHRLIFRAVRELTDRGQPIDVITVSGWLETHGNTELFDEGNYIVQLSRITPSAANIAAYAEIVKEKSILRQLIETGTAIATSAYLSEGRGSQELLEEAERQVFAIADRGARGRFGFVPVQEKLKEAIHRLHELSEHGGDITGLATGFQDFDKLTAGLQKSDLIIIAGRPSMGKTTFAMNVAEHVAIKHAVPVAVFSMEMSTVQLILRLFSSLGQIEQSRMKTGQLSDLDWPKLTSAMNLLHKSRIFIDETAALSPAELRARARRLKREHDIGMIVVDYLQLMNVPGTRENRATEIAEISRSLKAIAKELNIPVVALSQLNRSLEQRPNKRPIMADLRESGSIEQDADLIVFIYRDEVYNPDTAEKGKAEIIIGKHRNGETGTVNLSWQGRWMRFVNFAPDYFYSDHAG